MPLSVTLLLSQFALSRRLDLAPRQGQPWDHVWQTIEFTFSDPLLLHVFDLLAQLDKVLDGFNFFREKCLVIVLRNSFHQV